MDATSHTTGLCSLHIPGIVQFCTCGSLCFTWIFFLSITFFPAVLCLDQQRVEKDMCQCMCCFNSCSSNTKEEQGGEVPDHVTNPSDVKSSWAGEKLTPIITSKVGKIIICGFCVGYAALSGYLLTLNGTGLSVSDVVPDDSYVIELTDTTDKYWTGKLTRNLQIVFKGDFYADSAKVTQMYEYFTWAEGLDYTLGIVGGTSGTWYQAYTTWLDAHGGAAAGYDHYANFHDVSGSELRRTSRVTWESTFLTS